ncbi:MAG: hypothetical protein VW475_05970, partial [Curvibacter sp.]
ALSTLDFRLDAAYHLYGKNNTRIYRGVMPHFLYAIGVLEVQVDPRGNVQALNWMRAPEHAPEVIAEIERTVRQAAPFPAPVQLGSTSYAAEMGKIAGDMYTGGFGESVADNMATVRAIISSG